MSNGMTLTNAGRDLLALALTGTELHFTRGAVGDGELQEGQDIRLLSGLISEKKNLGIQSITTSQTGTCEAVMVITNENQQTGLWLREYGLFVRDPEDNTKEILYAYCNKGNTAGYLEGYDGANPIHFKLTLITVIDQAENITATLTIDDDYVSVTELEERIDAMFTDNATTEGVWCSNDGKFMEIPFSTFKNSIMVEASDSEVDDLLDEIFTDTENEP